MSKNKWKKMFSAFLVMASRFTTPLVIGVWTGLLLALPLAELGKLSWVTKKSPNYYGSIRSLVSPEWHYIEHQTVGTELYDWENDLLERENLVQNPGEQAVITRFRTLLERITGQ